MRTLLISISVIFMLFVTPSAGAALPAAVPGAWCDWEAPSVCYTHEEGDGYLMDQSPPGSVSYIYVKDSTGARSFSGNGCTVVNTYAQGGAVYSSGSCTRVRGWYQHHHFKRYHKYQFGKYAWISSYYVTYIAQDGVVNDAYSKNPPDVQIDPGFNRPFCYADPANPYVTTDMNGAQIPTPNAPADYVAACYPDRTTTDTSNETNETDPKPPAPKPEVGPCPLITVGKKTAKVVRVDLSCLLARNTIAKYLRTGREAPGFTCLRVRTGKTLVGKCVKDSSGRSGRKAVVTGTIRLR